MVQAMVAVVGREVAERWWREGCTSSPSSRVEVGRGPLVRNSLSKGEAAINITFIDDRK